MREYERAYGRANALPATLIILDLSTNHDYVVCYRWLYFNLDVVGLDSLR